MARDPALPELRHVVDHTKAKMEGVHEEAQRYTGPFELPEAGEEDVAWVRRLVGRELED